MHFMRNAWLMLLALLPTLSAAATHVPAGCLIEVAQARLRLRAEGIPAEWQFIPSGTPMASAVIADGELSIEAGDVDGTWPRSRAGVPVTLRVDGAIAQTRMVWFTMRAWRDAHVYARDYRSGEAGDDLQTATRRVDIAAEGGDEVVAADAAAPVPRGYRLLRDVRAGQPVLARDLGPMPAVARNTRVALQVRRAGLALSTAALARDDGVVGEVVRVLPQGATQWIRAAVTGHNEVTIEN